MLIFLLALRLLSEHTVAFLTAALNLEQQLASRDLVEVLLKSRGAGHLCATAAVGLWA